MADQKATLFIGATVDKEAMIDGIAAGAAGIKVSTDQMGVYFDGVRGRAQSAWKKISEDTRAGAATVNAESLKIATASKAVTDAQTELAAAISLVRNKLVEQAVSLPLMAAAYENVRQKMLELKEAQGAVAEVSHKAVTDVQATSAAIRSFEGNPGIRAMEVFVGRTLGLGPLLQKVFPLIGAAAFLDILFGVGERMYELEKKGKAAGEELSRAFGEFNEKLSTANDQLALTNAKLEEEIAKLSGHPTNGVAVALAEATVAADRLQDALAADVKELQALLKEKSVSAFEGELSGVAGTATSDKKITEASKLLEKEGEAAQAVRLKTVDVARTAYEQERAAAGQNQQALKSASDRFHDAQLAADRTYYSTQRTQAEAFAREMRRNATGTAETQTRLDYTAKMLQRDHGTSVTPVDLTPERTAYEGAAVAGDRFGRRAQESQQNLDDERGVGAAKAAKEGLAATSKVAEERLRAMEVEYSDLEHWHRLTLKEEHDFWAARIGEFARGSEQYKQLAVKIGQLDQQGAVKAKEAIAKFTELQKRTAVEDGTAKLSADKGNEDVNRLLREQAEDVTRTGERWASYNASLARGAEIAAKLQESMEEGRLHILEEEGAISKLGVAQVQARIHADEHARALKALRDELVALKAAGAGLKPGDKGFEQNASQQQNVQNQISQEIGNGQSQKQTDQAAISAAMSKPYLTAFNAIDSGWLKVQRDLIQGNRNISRDFAQMGLNLVQTLAAHVEQIIANFARMEIRTVVMHAAANAQKLAGDATAAASGAAIAKGSELTQGLAAAKLAFKNTYASVSSIPVIGPFIAPVVAAGAFAAVEAFEYGGIVGGSTGMAVPILAHAGERVLNPYQTQNFERMVNSSGGSGAQTINIGGNHSYRGEGSADFGSQLTEHRMKLVKVLKRLKREGHI